MLKFGLRIGLTVCAALVLLMIAARVLGEGRPRSWLALISNRTREDELVALDVGSGMAFPLGQRLDAIAPGGLCVQANPGWSSDGWLAVTHACEHQNRIVTINFNSGRIASFTPRDVNDAFYTWTPAGQIAFSSTRSGMNEGIGLYVGDPATGQAAKVSSFVMGGYPVWSSDGWLALVGVSQGWMRRIYVFDQQGGIRRIADNQSISAPVWLPDGRLAFQKNAENGFHVYTYHVINGQTRRVAFFPYNTGAIYPVSPDGRLTLTLDGDVWLLDVDSGATTNLTAHPARDCCPSWTPDGRLAFESNRSRALYLLDLQTGTLSTLGGNLVPSSPAWAR